jgi:hypothetical protein
VYDSRYDQRYQRKTQQDLQIETGAQGIGGQPQTYD